MNTDQAAEMMGLTPRKFRDYASQRKLPRQHEGIRVYYRRELILAEMGRREARRNAVQQAERPQAERQRDAQPPHSPATGTPTPERRPSRTALPPSASPVQPSKLDKLIAAQQALGVLADLVTVIKRV